jgi:hypothetical protein
MCGQVGRRTVGDLLAGFWFGPVRFLESSASTRCARAAGGFQSFRLWAESPSDSTSDFGLAAQFVTGLGLVLGFNFFLDFVSWKS